MESTLRSLPGVFDVKAKLIGRNLGEAEILYNPAEVTLENLKEAVPSASGERHKFAVISATDSLP